MLKEMLLSAVAGPLLILAALFLLLGVLLGLRHLLLYHTVRVYNWDGETYRFLGRERLWRVNDTYVINLREALGEASYSTRYLLLASAEFVKTRRYGSLLFRAGCNEAWLPIEERMRKDLLYTHSRLYGSIKAN